MENFPIDREPSWDEPFNYQLIAERKLLQRTTQPEPDVTDGVDVYQAIEQYLSQTADASKSHEGDNKNSGLAKKAQKSIVTTESSPSLQKIPLSLFKYCPDASLNNPQQLVDYLCNPQNPNPLLIVGDMSSDNRMVYVYVNGVYSRVSWIGIKGMIKRILPLPLQTRDKIESIMYAIQTELPQVTLDYLNRDEDIINFQNGIFHFRTGKLVPHSPDVYSTIQIPCNYVPNQSLSKAPVFLSFLKKLTNGRLEEQTFIMEYIGAILSNVPGFRFKKALILYGPGNTGKSQFRELVQYLVGHHNCHTLDLDKMECRFGAAQAFGKRLVGSGDLPSGKIKELAIFKAMSGGDEINGEFKGENAFSFRFRGFLLYCCNKLPKFSGDQGGHVYQRFIIIRCSNVIPPEQQDKKLLEKMQAEADIIACVAVHLFRKAIERGYRFTESQNMIALRDEYANKNSSVVRFLSEVCNLSNGRTKRSEFYLAYSGWCSCEHIHAEPKSIVFEILEDVYGIKAFKSGEYYLPLSFKKGR